MVIVIFLTTQNDNITMEMAVIYRISSSNAIINHHGICYQSIFNELIYCHSMVITVSIYFTTE